MFRDSDQLTSRDSKTLLIQTPEDRTTCVLRCSVSVRSPSVLVSNSPLVPFVPLTAWTALPCAAKQVWSENLLHWAGWDYIDLRSTLLCWHRTHPPTELIIYRFTAVHCTSILYYSLRAIAIANLLHKVIGHREVF